MPNYFLENQKLLRERRPSHTDYKDGVTGLLDTSGSLIADAAQGLEAPYIWVRLDGNRSATRVVCTILDRHTAGFGVETAINVRSNLREITDILTKTYSQYPEHVINRARTPDGGQGVGETDILAGRIEPATDISATHVRARTFQWDDGTFPSSAEYALLDLASSISAISSSMSAGAAIYADPADGQLHVALGAEHGQAYPYTQADFDAIGTPYGATPLAGLVLFNGQTAITDSFTPFVRYWDRRGLLDAKGVASAGWLVRTATTVPTGLTLVQPGTVRVAATLTLNGVLSVI